MPRPKFIHLLPPELRKELDERLIQNGFAGYIELAEWLTEKGYAISHGPLHRYGQQMKRDFEKTLSRLRMAGQLVAQMPDDAENALDKINAIALRDMVFELIGAIQDFDADADNPALQAKLVSELSLTQARLSRAGVNRQKWVSELRAKTEAAANAVENLAQRSGLNAETAAAIRREILGIAP